MTVKQIAEAVGKDETSVRRWVKKAAGKMTAITGKMTASTSTHPADYTLDETIQIIESGMGKNAAAIFRQNAETSTAIAPLGDATEIATIVRETVTAMVPAIIAAIKGALSESTVPALPEANELTYRDQLRRVINRYVHRSGVTYPEAWRDLYSEYYYRYHRNLTISARNRGMDTLDYVESEGLTTDLLSLAVSMYGAAA